MRPGHHRPTDAGNFGHGTRGGDLPPKGRTTTGRCPSPTNSTTGSGRPHRRHESRGGREVRLERHVGPFVQTNHRGRDQGLFPQDGRNAPTRAVAPCQRGVTRDKTRQGKAHRRSERCIRPLHIRPPARTQRTAGTRQSIGPRETLVSNLLCSLSYTPRIVARTQS